MFWKRKEGKEGTEAAKPKAKKLSPNEIFANQIEQQLTPGQTLRFKIPETSELGYKKVEAGFVNLELNPQYPQKGKKYVFSAENIVNGMPGGKRTIMYETDKSIDLATSILDRNGAPFVVAK